jgi:hypothetical protein
VQLLFVDLVDYQLSDMVTFRQYNGKFSGVLINSSYEKTSTIRCRQGIGETYQLNADLVLYADYGSRNRYVVEFA